MPSKPLAEDVLRDMAARDARAAARSAALKALAEIGMTLARTLSERVREAKSGAAIDEQVLAFTRIAEAVRLTIALDVRLADAHRTRRGTRAAEVDAKSAGVSGKATVDAARARA